MDALGGCRDEHNNSQTNMIFALDPVHVGLDQLYETHKLSISFSLQITAHGNQ